MYKLIVFIPETHTEQVKTALFAAGAGRQGDYDCCAWQTLGQGQFRPLDGSKPFIGQQGDIETVAEYRVEMLCEEAQLKAVVSALREAHPYEEPAFEVIQLVDIDG
jgi:hypothetical protein